MNAVNLSLFMRPRGSTSTFTLAGAVGDRGSKTMLASEGAPCGVLSDTGELEVLYVSRTHCLMSEVVKK